MSSQRYYCRKCCRIFFDDTNLEQFRQDLLDVVHVIVYNECFDDSKTDLTHCDEYLVRYNESPENRIAYLEDQVRVLRRKLVAE